jgi:hypothetical protein
MNTDTITEWINYRPTLAIVMAWLLGLATVLLIGD